MGVFASGNQSGLKMCSVAKWDSIGNESLTQRRSFKLYYRTKPLQHLFFFSPPPLGNMVSIWWRSRIEDQIPALKKQTFSYVVVSDLGKIHTSHKYIRHGFSMLLPDVCAAPCERHIKCIGERTKLGRHRVTFSIFSFLFFFFQLSQSRPKRSVRR